MSKRKKVAKPDCLTIEVLHKGKNYQLTQAGKMCVIQRVILGAPEMNGFNMPYYQRLHNGQSWDIAQIIIAINDYDNWETEIKQYIAIMPTNAVSR